MEKKNMFSSLALCSLHFFCSSSLKRWGIFDSFPVPHLDPTCCGPLKRWSLVFFFRSTRPSFASRKALRWITSDSSAGFPSRFRFEISSVHPWPLVTAFPRKKCIAQTSKTKRRSHDIKTKSPLKRIDSCCDPVDKGVALSDDLANEVRGLLPTEHKKIICIFVCMFVSPLIFFFVIASSFPPRIFSSFLVASVVLNQSVSL